MKHLQFSLIALFFIQQCQSDSVCYQCHANGTDIGAFCSIDKLCRGVSCFFRRFDDSTWESGCSEELVENQELNCKAEASTKIAECFCNKDFCNSLGYVETALDELAISQPFMSTRRELMMPFRDLVYCKECGTVKIGEDFVDIPCDRKHVCRGNYCVSVSGSHPYSYCGGDWDDEPSPGCYLSPTEPTKCICSRNMCNELLDPSEDQIIPTEPIMDIDIQHEDGPLNLVLPDNSSKINNEPIESSTIKTTKKPKKKKCKPSKFSPNDQAVFMGVKLKDAIVKGFGDDVQSFEDDINKHICNTE